MYLKTRESYNQYQSDGQVTVLTIIRRNGVKVRIKLDTEDAGRVRDLGTWKWNTGQCDQHYAAHMLHSMKSVMLARFIMLTPDHLYTTFKNDDSTDCRKSNLQNVPFEKVKPNATGYPYVYESVERGMFRAAVYDPTRKQSVFVGHYNTTHKARCAQWRWLEQHPHHRVPGMTSDPSHNNTKCKS